MQTLLGVPSVGDVGDFTVIFTAGVFIGEVALNAWLNRPGDARGSASSDLVGESLALSAFVHVSILAPFDGEAGGDVAIGDRWVFQ